MDVVNAGQVRLSPFSKIIIFTKQRTTTTKARIAEEAGACAVMALERVPADIRKEGGVARMVTNFSPLTSSLLPIALS